MRGFDLCYDATCLMRALCSRREHAVKPRSAYFYKATVTLVWILLCGNPLFGQNPTGRISGRVLDQSGLPIPGAIVKAKNLSTGFERESIINEAGEFFFNELPADRYQITAQSVGFSTEVVPEVVVRIGEMTSVPMVLKIGEVSTSISVTEAVPLLQSDNAEIGGVIEEKRVVGLPLNGRKYVQLAFLTGGVNANTKTTFGNLANLTSPELSINGQRITANSFRLDGSLNQAPSFQIQAVSPTIDSISEFRVFVNNYGADKGLYAGQVSIATVSGSGQFHGDLFEFFRNDVLDARNFFDVKKPPFRQNQFGATAGFPIKPRKIFFFGSWEALRRTKGLSKLQTVPTIRERAGDFSELSKPIIDPLTGKPFDGNIIPPERFNPVGVALLDLFPLPNLPGLTRNFVNNAKEIRDEDLFSTRVDVNLSDKDILFGRFSFEDVSGLEPFTGAKIFTNADFLPGFGVPATTRGTNLTIRYTRIVRPNLINQFGFAWTHFRGAFSRENTKDFAAQHGILGVNRNPAFFGIPQIATSSQGIVGDPIAELGTTGDNLFQWRDDLSYTRGNHAFDFGTEIIRWELGSFSNLLGRGAFAFLGKFSQNDVADLLLGFPASAATTEGIPTTRQRRTTWHFYAQDKWRLRPGLTVNLGLRYEYSPPYLEADNRIVAFDSSFPGGRLVAPGDEIMGPFVEGLTEKLQAAGRIAFGSQLGLPRTLIQSRKTDFAPRVGIAWSPFRAFIIRTGYGIYFAQSPSSARGGITQAPPFFAQFFSFPAKPVPTQTVLQQAVAGTPSAGGIFTLNDSNKTPYVQQWNFGIQQGIGKKIVLEADYSGNKGTHLDITVEKNLFDPGTTPLATRVEFPVFQRLNVPGDPIGFSTYHAFILKAALRETKGLSLEAAFTVSKAIDDGSDNFGGDAGSARAQNPKNIAAEKGLSTFDQRTRFSLSGLYDLPVGPQRPFFSGVQNPIVKSLIEGWRVGWIVTTAAGLPFTIGDTRNLSGDTAGNNQKANLVGDPNPPGFRSTPNEFFNTAAFAPAAPGTFGNVGRNTVIGPVLRSVDLSLIKETTLKAFTSESMKLEFRAEFFNAFNRANFDTPVRTVNSADFGRILSAEEPREIQFGLKLKW